MLTAEHIPIVKEFDLSLRKMEAAKTSAVPESHWMFYKRENSTQIIQSLAAAFSQLRNSVDQSKAIFLDCGSGDGIAALLAHFAGFEHVYGIEKNEYLHQLSIKNLAALAKEGKVPENSVRFVQGSYYEEALSQQTLEKCLNLLKEMHAVETNFESYELSTFVSILLSIDINNQQSLEKAVKNYIFSKQNVYRKTGLVQKGKIKADVVYIYPSDIFFKEAFIPQMEHCMKSGAVLTVLAPEDDFFSVGQHQFTQAQKIELQNTFDPAMHLQVFERK